MCKENSLKNLAKIFSDMPGIGVKSAWKMVFYILKLDKKEVLKIADTLVNVSENTKKCRICQNYTEREICSICSDPKRKKDLICVVESSRDVISFERTNSFFGTYHVLHGLISPIEGIGPKQIAIKELLINIKNNEKIKQVILATSPTAEGEATAMYISKLLKPLNILVSRLAYGISIGSEIQYADNMTILKAMENRNKL